MTSRRKWTTVGFLLSGGLILGASSCGIGTHGPAKPSELVQGWSAQQRSDWYEGTQ